MDVRIMMEAKIPFPVTGLNDDFIEVIQQLLIFYFPKLVN